MGGRVNPPILAAAYFGSGHAGDQYGRLARVLDYTARLHCPDWTIRVERLKAPPSFSSALGVASHVTNSQKLEWWRSVVVDAEDGDRVLLIDADMMITRPLEDVWRIPFDLAYTYRQEGRLPLNGGVVFVRVSPAARRFVDRWFAMNQRFLANANEHRHWRTKYAGINQAAFGYMLERERDPAVTIAKLTCHEWNAENTAWAKFDPNVTRIVHLKSGLRRALFGMPARPEHKRLITLWHALEAQANAAAAPTARAIG
jgi:hypothetical protein